MSLGLRERRIKKVISFFGGRETDAEGEIRDNPYALIELDGFGFTIVDYIAQKLGAALDSPERLSAFLIHLLSVICPSQWAFVFI